MKYFIDTEFIEGFKSSYFKLPLSYKQRHFIDLISIGIYCEDGREYYAVSNEYHPNDAGDWVKQNVLLPIAREHVPDYLRRNMHTDKLISVKHPKAKSNKQIANDILEFVYPKQVIRFLKILAQQPITIQFNDSETFNIKICEAIL